MFSCKVFNEFSVNPAWVQDFETEDEVSAFINRVKRTMFFKAVEISEQRKKFKPEEHDDIGICCRCARHQPFSLRRGPRIIQTEITH
jgi:hypothetical protein